MIVLCLISLYVVCVSLIPCCIRAPKKDQYEEEPEEDVPDAEIKTPVCCLCGKLLRTRGHNPYPFCEFDDAVTKCCVKCKHAYVIPARLSTKPRHRSDIEPKRKEIIQTQWDEIFKEQKLA